MGELDARQACRLLDPVRLGQAQAFQLGDAALRLSLEARQEHFFLASVLDLLQRVQRRPDLFKLSLRLRLLGQAVGRHDDHFDANVLGRHDHNELLGRRRASLREVEIFGPDAHVGLALVVDVVERR